MALYDPMFAELTMGSRVPHWTYPKVLASMNKSSCRRQALSDLTCLRKQVQPDDEACVGSGEGFTGNAYDEIAFIEYAYILIQLTSVN